jgi:hypothetical protein
MQGAPKRQVNAEEMLAELKRALESSTRAPNVPPPSPSTAPKSGSSDRKSSRSQIDRGSDQPVRANAGSSIGPRTDLQKSTRPSSRRWKLTAGGLALAGVAAVCASFVFLNKAPDLAERQPSVAATEGLARPQNEQTLEPSSAPEAAAPAFTPGPLNQAAALVAAHRIGPDGAPIPAAPSAPALPASTPPLTEAPKTAAPSAASQAIRPDGAPIATSPSTPASAPPLAGAPKTAAPSAASQAIRPAGAPIASAPSIPPSPASSPPLAEAPKTAAPSAASQAIRPAGAPIATAPSSAASTASAPLAETPKPNATRTASVSNESEPSTAKIDSKKKPAVKPPPQRPHKTANAPAKPPPPPERQPTEPAPPKEAEKSPEPAQVAGSPTAAPPVKTTSVQQRVADGVTHAFGYLIHLPGALVPHFGGPNPDAH